MAFTYLSIETDLRPCLFTLSESPAALIAAVPARDRTLVTHTAITPKRLGANPLGYNCLAWQARTVQKSPHPTHPCDQMYHLYYSSIIYCILPHILITTFTSTDILRIRQ